MSSDPWISIITPTFNRGPVLERAIRSVQAQTCESFEHIIVDDGSDDETEEIVKRVADHRLVYLKQPRRLGANRARNRGIEEARGEWITFLDSDDEFQSHRLETTIQNIESHPEKQLFLSSFLSIKNCRQTECINPEVSLSATGLEEALMSYAVMIAGTAITVHKELLQKSTGFAPSLGRLQDRELLFSLSRLSGAQVCSKIDWTKYYSHDSISGQSSGYVEAVDDLLGLHPHLGLRYRELLGYHVCRNVFKELTQFQFSSALAAWRANQRLHTLKFGLWEVLRAYRHGKKFRKSVFKKLMTETESEKAAA